MKDFIEQIYRKVADKELSKSEALRLIKGLYDNRSSTAQDPGNEPDENAWDGLTYLPGWEELSKAPSEGKEVNPKVILIVYSESSQQFAHTILAHYSRNYPETIVVQIRLDDKTAHVSDHVWRCGVGNPEGFDTCLRDYPSIDGFFFVAVYSNHRQMREIQLLRLTKYLQQRMGPDKSINSYILTLDNYRVQGMVTNSTGSGVTGLAYSIAQGDHRFLVRNIDMSHEDLENATAREGLLEQIFKEPASHRGEVIKLQSGSRYGQIFSKFHLGSSREGTGLKKDGVYVILGGSGVVGRIITSYLIRNYQAQVVWIGRSSETSSVVLEKLASLSELGMTPSYIQGDVTSLDSMKNAVWRIKKEFNKINGAVFSGVVFHHENSVNQTTETEFAEILDIKTRGVRNFYKALQDENLNFLCYFSSVQSFSFLSAKDSSGYAAGIAFADIYANSIAQHASFPVGVINWGFWEASTSGTDLEKRLSGHYGLISDAQGFRFFEKFIDSLQQGNAPKQVLCLQASKNVRKIMKCPENEIVAFCKQCSSASSESAHVWNKSASDKKEVDVLVKTHNPEDFERWMAHELFVHIRRMGVFSSPKNRWERCSTLQKEAGIAGKYERWWKECCLGILEVSGYLRREGDRLKVREDIPSIEDAKVWRKSLLKDPCIEAKLSLVDDCLKRLPEILRGSVKATDVIFPNSSMEKVENLYKNNDCADYFNTLIAELIQKYLQQRIEAKPDAMIRIIEVGAGVGGTTGIVLERLRSYENHIQEYCYTDISKAFLNYARKHYGNDFPFLKPKLWNIEDPLVDQGIDIEAYDIVIATNVLHATRDIRATLHNLKSVLKPNGAMILNEVVEKTIFGTLTFGLLDGWWLYEDGELRLPGSPLLHVDTWKKILWQEGFSSIQLPAKRATRLGQQIIVGESNGLIRRSLKTSIAQDKTDHTVCEVAPTVTAGKAADIFIEKSEFDLRAYVASHILEILSQSLAVTKDELDEEVPFSDYGLDSILGVGFVDQVNEALTITLNTAVIYNFTTVAFLTDHVMAEYQDKLRKMSRFQNRETATKNLAQEQNRPKKSSKLIIVKTENTTEDTEKDHLSVRLTDPSEIAIIGMSGQFPDAGDVDTFWKNLCAGDDGIHKLPEEYLIPGNPEENTAYKWGGTLADRACFDPLFFNISPLEAETMNPHQRLILQESWKGLEDSGYDPRSLADTRVGIFIGAEPSDYARETLTGASDALIASRLSYYLNLKGPAMVVNTGCSSSATAIHLACDSLRNRDSNIAIAGGVFATMDQAMLIPIFESGMLSPTGQCHSFDESGNGTVLSEGVGIVVLKRLSDAVAAGDSIYGVIKGIGVNQDGTCNGITAPNGAAQEELISDIYGRYGINPEEITYVETHGTATKLGDPVEANALVQAFKKHTSNQHYCAIGSAKSHIGHTGPSSGVIGLIKVLLSLKYHKIPGLLNFKKLNPLIEFQDSPFYINTELTEWRSNNHQPLTAALSSFGHSGTNVHMVVQEYLKPTKERELEKEVANGALGRPCLIVISARNEERLKAKAESLLTFTASAVANNSFSSSLANIAFTLQVGRTAMKARAAFLVTSLSELADRLKPFTEGKGEVGNCWQGHVEKSLRRSQLFDSDDDAQEMIAKWIAKGKLKQIAELWAQGGAIDWTLLYGAATPCRIHLPTYPFVKDHYWLDRKKSVEIRGFDLSIDQKISPQRNGAEETNNVPGCELSETGLLMMMPVWDLLPVVKDSIVGLSVTDRVVVVGGTLVQRKAVIEVCPNAQPLEIDFQDSVEAISALLDKMTGLDHIIWIAPDSPLKSIAADAFVLENPPRVVALFRLVKALLSIGYGLKELQWTLVTTQAQAIEKWEHVNPGNASIHGFAGSLAKEYPHWKIRLLDLQADRPWPLREMFGLPFDMRGDALAHRGTEWFKQSLILVEEPSGGQPTINGPETLYRSKGVYVVIGGAGGIGMAWTRYMAETYKARIIWIGRREKDAEIQEKIDAISRSGPAPVYFQADATDLISLQKAYDKIRQTHDRIHGVIHSAIVLSDKSLANMDEVEFQASFLAKADVCTHMGQVFQGESLDFVLFFSAMQSFVKAPGQSNYASGCTFKDAFAHQLAQEWSCPVKVMNWGYWGSVGVVADTAYRERMERAGQGSIEPEEAMTPLEFLLNGPFEQLALIKTLRPQAIEGVQPNERVTIYPETIPSLVHFLHEPAKKQAKQIEPLASQASKVWPHPAMESLALELLWGSFQLLGLPTEIDAKPGLPGFYDQWFEESVNLLMDRDYLELDEEKRNVTGPCMDMTRLWKAWEEAAVDWKSDPQIQAMAHLLEICLRGLPDILTGRRQATQVLFAESSVALVEGVQQGNMIADLYNDFLHHTVTTYLQQRLRQNPASQIRILEIGAGTGGTTAGLLAKLQPFVMHIDEYCYTDISRAFLIHGEQCFSSQNPFFKTAIFNVEAPVAGQNIKANHYDLVIASNVLHATRNVRETLRNAKAALSRNGLLIVNEISDKSLFTHLTFGLLEGWWNHVDSGIRIPGCPGLFPETWTRILKEEGFKNTFFPAESIHRLGQQIIVAESDGVVRQKNQGQSEISQRPDKATAIVASETNGRDIREQIIYNILDALAQALKLSKKDMDIDVPFSEYGIDSILGIAFVKQVNDRLELSLETTILFDYTTVDSLTSHILSAYGSEIGRKRKNACDSVKPCYEKTCMPVGANINAGKTEAVVKPRQLSPGKSQKKQVSCLAGGMSEDPSGLSEIAVIGMSGQFPGAEDINAFWLNLIEGHDGIAELPSHYLDKEKYFSQRVQPGKSYCRWGGILEDRDCFDPLFFNIAPSEAVSMNPHQRLILQETWKGLEDAGYNPKNLEKSKISLFIGAEPTGYIHDSFTGASEAIVASRLSYYLNLKGPALVVNTGCSSSGVAIHLACDHLRHGESKMAIAGGVFAVMNRDMLVRLSQIEMLSPTGRCKTFDSTADGTVFAEGVGVVVLKRLSDAIAAGDPIYGVIAGSGMNQDGASNGITAPSGTAQEELIVDVYKRFRINPEEITYAEAHGTGTKLGDPVEVNALVRAFKQFTDTRHYCALGSAKAHIGHTGASSGVIGLIKILLSLKHRKIPGLLHYEKINPLIKLQDSPFFINPLASLWQSKYPLTAALNSFGHSGTNVHIVVKEYQPCHANIAPKANDDNRPAIIPLSARTEEGLKAYAEKLSFFLESIDHAHPEINVHNIAHTLQSGREAMEVRAIFLSHNLSQLKEQLQAFTGGKLPIDGFWQGHADEEKSRGHLFDSEEEMQELFNQWLSKGEFKKVARFWAQGITMDWDLLYGADKPRRIHLPAYPFAKEKYCAADPGVKAAADQICEPTVTETLICRFVWNEKTVPSKSKTDHHKYSQHLVLLADVLDSPEAVKANQSDINWIRLQSQQKTLENRFEEYSVQVFETIQNLLASSQKGEILFQIMIPGHGQGRLLCGLAGILKTAHLENPKFTGQVIELDGEETAEAVVRLAIENSRCPEDAHIRYRNNRRQTIMAVEVQTHGEPTPNPWKDGGIYLITGGAGGLGSIFTREIASKCNKAKLILTGRSPLTREKENDIKKLSSLGASVDYRQVDVSEKKAVEDLIEDIQREFGKLNGIIHSAGVIRDNFILKKESSELKAVFAPKVAGTVNLDQATCAIDLDFFLLFSAGAAVTGNPGQADYAAANAFMDGYALYRNDLVRSGERCGHTVSINWPLWKEGGMGVDPEIEKDMRQSAGMTPMETVNGILALTQVMASNQSQIMVIEGDPARLRQFLFEGKSKSRAPSSKRSTPGSSIQETTIDQLKRIFGEVIELPADRFESRKPLVHYGIDSIVILKLNRKLAEVFGKIPKTLLYEYQTLKDLADYFVEQYPNESMAWTAMGEEATSFEAQQVFYGEKNRTSGEQEPIAIIGIAGHYPKADTIEAFWENLKTGRDCITEIPAERWSLAEFYEGDPEKALSQVKSYVKRGGFLKGFSDFDPRFFNISPADVLSMDPQERLILTTCWEAMEDSGYSRQLLHERYDGDVGVFIGVTKSGFNLHTRMGTSLKTSRLPVTSFSSMANRVSYHLNLSGPSMAIDTMCSSSITAIHEACEHIRRGDCQLAFAGAVNLYLHPRPYLDLCLSKVVSHEPAIHCFSKTGKGFIPGEGVGAVLLKPLDHAVRDDDHIEGVILGSGINHGGQTNGYTVPNPKRQRELISNVLRRCGCDANTIDYIESAANGSAMGDALEFEALKGAFKSRKGGPCYLGSLKPNMGHAEAASGLAQLTKVLCQLKYRTLAPTRIDPERLDNGLKWDQSPFRLVTKTVTQSGFNGPDPEEPQTALITSAGAGGSYAAMVVREYQSPNPVFSQNQQLILLSARTESQLKTYAKHLHTYLGENNVSLLSLAYTLQQGRDSMRFRLGITARDQDSLMEILDVYCRDQEDVRIKAGDSRKAKIMGQDLSLQEIEDRAAKALADSDLGSLADLWLGGYDQIEWDKLHSEKTSRCRLPTYPFERRSFWFEEVDCCTLSEQDQERENRGSEETVRNVLSCSETEDRQHVQEILIDIIREILFLGETEELDEEDTFTDLGLDSINGVHFIEQLSKRLDLSLRQTLIFDYPSIGTLAGYITQKNKQIGREVSSIIDRKGENTRFKAHVGRLMKVHEEIVPLQIDGEGPVLFCIHPMSGDVGLYKSLAEAAQKRFRVIGIKARGFLTDKQPLNTMEEMAHYYAEIITAFDHEGPFHLFGSSMGGTVAYETARCLQLKNKIVKTLLLAESPLIESDRDAGLWKIDEKQNWIMNANFLMITMLHLDPEFRQRKRDGHVHWSTLEITEDHIQDMRGETIADSLVTLIKGQGVKQTEPILRQRLGSMADVHLANLGALRHYRAQFLCEPASLKALLFSTRSAIPVSDEFYNPDYLVRVQQDKGSMAHFFKGWKRVLPQLETKTLPGENHFDLLSGEATVRALAESIAKTITPASTPPTLPKPVTMIQKSPGHISDRKVAIIGMSGQFPGGETLDDFWQLLKNGQSAFTPFPKNRYWDEGETKEKAYIRRGAFLKDIDTFDPLFFRIPPKEAEMMDPAERLFLQESWHAIEDAGLDPLSLSGAPWGVFCGGGGDYTLLLKEILGVSPHVTPSSIPGRVSYSLNLTGPSLQLDVGCASSLMAVAQACDNLIFGRCDIAIAGGILISSTPNLIITGCRSQLFSETGRSHAFDAKADGMMPGEGVGVLILKPLELALADKDRIHGVIEGWGNNHSGKTNGMAAPSVLAQVDLLTDVYQQFQINPETISMVEANATGTVLGDTMEIQALTTCFRKFTDKKRYCALGTVENNVGHAFQGSGMTHMMKVLLAMRHMAIPATPNIETVNRALDLENSPFFINTETVPWLEKGNNDHPRRASVSSFGATGTNVHLVISEPPQPEEPDEHHLSNEGPELIVLSARTKTALKKRCEALKEFMADQGQEQPPSLANISANLLLRRSHFPERSAMVVSDRNELAAQLSALINEADQSTGLKDTVFVGSIHKNEKFAASELLKATIHAIRNKKSREKENLLVLGELYVKGAILDLWDSFSAAERFPVSLPTYPFEKRRCRLHEPAAVKKRSENDSILVAIQKFVTEITGYKADEIALDESLNRYGLDSLMSMRLLAMINERFSMNLQLADLLDQNSVKRLAAMVKNEASVTLKSPAKKKAIPFAMSEQDNWLRERLSNFPEDLRFLNVENEDMAAEKSSPDALKFGEQSLAILLHKGIALFNQGARCSFFSHHAVDIQAVLDSLSMEQRRHLLSVLPVRKLVAPVSQEQRRNLYHSEVMKQSAWNIKHIYELTDRTLDFSLLDEAMALVVSNHDLLRTDYIGLGEGIWGQVIAPEVRLEVQVLQMPSLPALQQFIETERSQLITLDKGSLFKIWVSRIEQKYFMGFVAHHSLADAFTTTMLMSELMDYYHQLSKGQRPLLRPIAEQYWLYALRQFDRNVYGKARTRQNWQHQLADRSMSMNLPFVEDSHRTHGDRLQASSGHIITLSAPLVKAIDRFNEDHGITHTQLFLSAITVMLVHGMGNPDSMIHFINNQRDRVSLLNTLGEFTNVLFIPFESKETARDLTAIEMMRAVKEKVLKSLGFAKTDFNELLSLTGLNDYDTYYCQTGDVMVDSADIDRGTLDSFSAFGRSLFADTLFHQQESSFEEMAGQTLASLFYQILKVDQQIHLITSYRKHLFDKVEMRRWAEFIVNMVEKMVYHPEQTIDEILRKCDDFKEIKHGAFDEYRDARIISALDKINSGTTDMEELEILLKKN
jgi:acyl transferase domain-containing protein/SAM-dependent methyltransferase/pimeloyl-ACP methyl ester carboxylesterase